MTQPDPADPQAGVPFAPIPTQRVLTNAPDSPVPTHADEPLPGRPPGAGLWPVPPSPVPPLYPAVPPPAVPAPRTGYPPYPPYPPYPGYPGHLDAAARPAARTSGRWARQLLTLLILISFLLAAGGLASLAVSVRAAAGSGQATWVDTLRPEVRSPAIQALLDRRVAAIRALNKVAFMADVDPADPAYARRQEVLYDNLSRLPLAQFEYQVESRVSYPKLIPQAVARRYPSGVIAAGVTVRYRVEGVDSKAVAAPWVPILGYRGGRWYFAGEAVDRLLPYGANAQAWDADQITVARSDRVVAVLSSDDGGRADLLLNLAEKGLKSVAVVRPGGWDGRIFLLAVQDQRVFERYFADSPDRVAAVAAIAVPYYDKVAEWHDDASFAATRIVINPQQLSAQPEELAHDLAHEFAHAAMGPVTTSDTPRWLVEGFAEYVAYKSENVSSAALRKALKDVDLAEGLPPAGTFYADPDHYVVAWLACRMIAERYGEKRLVRLYEAFQQSGAESDVVKAELGVSLDTLTSQWRQYVERLRA